jgi:hypothetical protein
MDGICVSGSDMGLEGKKAISFKFVNIHLFCSQCVIPLFFPRRRDAGCFAD